jgi:hypothetical protein
VYCFISLEVKIKEAERRSFWGVFLDVMVRAMVTEAAVARAFLMLKEMGYGIRFGCARSTLVCSGRGQNGRW